MEVIPSHRAACLKASRSSERIGCSHLCRVFSFTLFSWMTLAQFIDGKSSHEDTFEGQAYRMANSEHLARLNRGIEAWNAWRKNNSAICPDLSCADLSYRDLRNVDLDGANLVRASLFHANLRDANLSHAILRGADLGEADLQGTIFTDADLRGATFSRAKELVKLIK